MKLYLTKNQYLTGICFLFLLTLFVLFPGIHWFGDFREKEFFIAVVGLWGLIHFMVREKINTLTTIDVFVLLFVIYQILHFSVLGNSSFFELLFWWRLSFVVLYFIFKELLIQYQDHIKNLFVSIILLRFIMELAIGLLQYLEFITIAKSDYFKVVGTFTSANHYAFCLAIGMLTLWTQLKKFKRVNRLLLYVVTSILSICSLFLIAYTTSRTAILAVVVVCCLLFLVKKGFITKISAYSKQIKLGILAILIALLSVSGYLLYTLKKDSADGRIFCAKITLSESIKKPIFGHGLFTYEEGYNTAKSHYFTKKKRDWSEIKIADHVSHAMNDYLEILYEIGVVGLLLLAIVLFKILKSAKSYDPNYYSGLAIVIFLMICGLFSTLIANSFFFLTFLYGVFLIVDKNILLSTIKGDNNRRVSVLILIASLLLISIGGTKIYAFGWIKEHRKKDIATTKFSDWKLWTNIMAYNGYYEFMQGAILHDDFKRRKRGLRIMEQGVMKNKKPQNIRKIALYSAHNGDLKKAENLLKFNIGNEPYLFEPRFDLAIIYQKTNQKQKYIAMLREIINLPEKVPSDKVKEFKSNATKRLSEALKN